MFADCDRVGQADALSLIDANIRRRGEDVISHWVAVIVLLLVVAGGMALAWPHRKKPGAGSGFDIDGPGSAIEGEGSHHSSGDGFSAHD
jgi:hypothetical protein